MLTSHLLGLNPAKELIYLMHAFFPEDSPDKYDRRLFTREQIIKDYALVSLATRFFDIGKKAADTIINQERLESSWHRGWSYPKMHKVRFPVPEHIPVAVNYPPFNEIIDMQKEMLEDRFGAAERREHGYKFLSTEERDSVLTFRDFLHKIRLY